MKQDNFLKAFEVLAEKITDLEGDLLIEKHRVERLQSMIESAEREVKK